MANANKPTGLTPVKYLSGADWDGRGNGYFLPQADANTLFVGDCVKLAAGADTKTGLPTIARAAAGDALVGVVLAIGIYPMGGPYIDPTNLTLLSAPATKTKSYYVFVADDPNIIYEAQEGGTGYNPASPLTNTAASKNASIFVGTPGTGVNLSAVVIDASTVATTATLALKLMGVSPRPDNALGGFCKWLCKINNHQYGAGTGTAGV